MDSKKRIDLVLVETGCFPSRERARSAVLSGLVLADGQVIDKPGSMVRPDADIRVKVNPNPYVSRGGLKLEAALEAFGIQVKDRVCLDVGASTGGFTHVLLSLGARKVYAVDVGYGQLAWQLRTDPKVVVMERTNARHLTADMFDEAPSLCTIDVSFISSRKILPSVKGVLAESPDILLLVKPQFEAERAVSKKGVIRNPGDHVKVLADVNDAWEEQGFFLEGVTHSPVVGPKGNIEFWFFLKKGSRGKPADLNQVVAKAHDSLRGGDI